MALADAGYLIFDVDGDVQRWAGAAHQLGRRALQEQGDRRHGGTWFVGVDALPNAPDGSIDGVSLAGPWQAHIDPPTHWHHAQLSVIFPGYPQRDPDESEAAHRYRRDRDAAHVDGLLPEGPAKRRHLREPHGFILGLPLNDARASPLVVWPGSHLIMQAAFQTAYAGLNPAQFGDLDVTDIYQAARRRVFAECDRVPVIAMPGQAVLLHRHVLHGVAPWDATLGGDCRMIAYFRPLVSPGDWLTPATY